jgi:hypothetical protein
MVLALVGDSTMTSAIPCRLPLAAGFPLRVFALGASTLALGAGALALGLAVFTDRFALVAISPV